MYSLLQYDAHPVEMGTLRVETRQRNAKAIQSIMIQDTSLFAYSVATQNLGAKQKQVLDALRFFPDATNAEIAAH